MISMIKSLYRSFIANRFFLYSSVPTLTKLIGSDVMISCLLALLINLKFSPLVDGQHKNCYDGKLSRLLISKAVIKIKFGKSVTSLVCFLGCFVSD